jgi:hypothetical protein
MPDPLTIVIGCSSLISNIRKLFQEIYSFVSKVRDAHGDLDAVLKKNLAPLSLCVEKLHNDAMVTS